MADNEHEADSPNEAEKRAGKKSRSNDFIHGRAECGQMRSAEYPASRGITG